MTFRSAIYVGSVMHRRLQPRRHHFNYRAFWLLFDLDELAELSSGLRWFSYNRPNLFSLYDSDHGEGSATPLRIQIERQVAEAGVDLAGGRIHLLCMPRTFGYCFNPLSVFFCHRANGELAAIVYQVHNTFAQRHSYIFPVGAAGEALHQQCRKHFVVVGICASRSGKPVLSAVLAGSREPLTSSNLLRVCVRMPAITLKVTAAIHWEALKLWVKRIGFRRRPAAPVRATTIVSSMSAALD